MGKRKTDEQYKQQVKEFHGDTITVLGEYTRAKDSIYVQCNLCGHHWNPTAKNLISGPVSPVAPSECPICHGR